MLRIGITGGIGSGKTYVSNIVQKLGYPVFNADFEARIISDNDPKAVREIKSIFGDDIYHEGKLDRMRVASMVFTSPSLLESLSRIVHPLVSKRFNEWVHANRSASLVFMESAILFESESNLLVDRVIVVSAPKELRIKRVVARDGIAPEQVTARMLNQTPEEEITRRANMVIVNDDTQLLLPQVISIIAKLEPIVT